MPVLSLWGLPIRPTGQEAVAKVSPGHMCPLSRHLSLWCGDKVVLQWGGPYQLGSHPIPGQRPTTARVAGAGSAPLPCRTSFLLLGEDQELWTSPGLRHIPGESPRTQTLLSGAAGAAGVMLQPRLSRHRQGSREKTSGDVSVTGAVARSPVLCPWRRCQTWSSLLRRRGLQCSVPPAPATCCLSRLGRAETPVIGVSVPQIVGR